MSPGGCALLALLSGAYLVEWSGLRLFFTGDTEDPGALLAARDLDVAFVSPWLLRRIVDDDRRVDARRVVVSRRVSAQLGPGSRCPAATLP
jgi:hypothetical protein